MTTGGMVEQDPTTGPLEPRHTNSRTWRDRLHDPRLAQHLPALLAVGVFAACYARYRQRWFIPGYATYLLDVHKTVVDGTAIAPNQYRPLIPHLCAVLADALSLPIPTTILAVDGLLLIVAVLALRSLLARIGAPPGHLLAAAAVFAFWFTKLDHWSPETMLLIALVALVARELAGERPRWGDITACGLVMLGARTDYVAALGVTIIAIGVAQRSWRIGVLGGFLITAAGLATKTWQAIYPQAHYQVDVVQLPFNLSPGSCLFVTTYYGTVLLVPLVLTLRTRALPPLWPVLAWFLAEFGAVFIVGRVEESRLFMPFAAVLGLAAMLAWTRLDAPRNTSVETSR